MFGKKKKEDDEISTMEVKNEEQDKREAEEMPPVLSLKEMKALKNREGLQN